MDQFEFFQFKKVGPLSRTFQIVTVAALYVGTIVLYWFQVQKTGKMSGYSPGVSLLFVPIYEELIFRGIVLKFFEKNYGKWQAVLFSSLLFGLWHLKNIFWLSPEKLVEQIVYTAVIFSPILSMITLKTRTLWLGVILHYLNNLPIR